MLAFAVWITTTSLMFLPPQRREKKFLNFDTVACVCLFAECVIKMGLVCLDWFKQCKLFKMQELLPDLRLLV